MKPFDQIVKRPLVTEKAVLAKENLGRYSFEVSLDASKPAIREAIQSFFKVNVTEVRTQIVRGKTRRMGRHMGRRPNWKKAVVTLGQGQKIEMFEPK